MHEILEVTPVKRDGPGFLDRRRKRSVPELLALWLDGKKPETVKLYRFNLQAFGRYLGLDNVEELLRRFLHPDQEEGYALALQWRNAMAQEVSEGVISANTLNSRLSTLRSIARLARRLGMIQWTLDLPGITEAAYRDTKGPGLEKIQAMIDTAAAQEDPLKALRDLALLRLAFDLGLRRAEIASLNVKDLDLEGGEVAVLGKKRTSREKIPLSEEAQEALSAYLTARGDPDGEEPLFETRPLNGGLPGRLRKDGIYALIKALGRKAGVGRVTPHQIRHSSITALLDTNGGNVREAQAFSRHRNPAVLIRYDDHRTDSRKRSVSLVARLLTRPSIGSVIEDLSNGD